jgi:hypothetical protein
MRWLLFISRIGFLCNICYAFSVIARYINLKLLHQDVVATIVVLGVVSILLNIIINIFWVISLIRKQKLLPVFLGFSNFVFLILQLLNILLFQL